MAAARRCNGMTARTRAFQAANHGCRSRRTPSSRTSPNSKRTPTRSIISIENSSRLESRTPRFNSDHTGRSWRAAICCSTSASLPKTVFLWRSTLEPSRRPSLFRRTRSPARCFCRRVVTGSVNTCRTISPCVRMRESSSSWRAIGPEELMLLVANESGRAGLHRAVCFHQSRQIVLHEIDVHGALIHALAQAADRECGVGQHGGVALLDNQPVQKLKSAPAGLEVATMALLISDRLRERGGGGEPFKIERRRITGRIDLM